MSETPIKFYWHANTSNGGTLSLSLSYEGKPSKKEKESVLAESLSQLQKHMEDNGFIPFDAQLMSSSDIAQKYGSSRQYWEKLLNEGKILYKETSAGRITTDLWVNGYLKNKEEVNKYVRDVQTIIKSIGESKKRSGTLTCPVCGKERFEYYVNYGNTNGLCRACSFHVHTVNDTE